MSNSIPRATTRRTHALFLRLPLLLTLMVASATLLAAPGETQGPPGADGYVIGAGREAEVLALFSPLPLPGEVVEGWTLANLSIERSHIVCDMRGPDGRSAQVLLVPKGTRSGAPFQTTSFSVVAGEGDLAPPETVVEAIHDVVARNDTSRFYRVDVTRLLATGRNAGLIDARWLVDGIAWSAVALLLLLILTFTHLRRERWTISALVLGAFVVGIALRFLMSENVAMGAWPFSRWNSVTLSIANGPGLALLSETFDTSWTRHELATGITFAFALVTPLALFVHARYLLNDARVAVAAAWIIALLPQHIRFSHSEVAFIPSLVLGALLFATCHMGLRERSLSIRALAWIALPFISTYTYSARPLNVVFFPLVVWMTFGLDHAGVPLRRKLGVVALTGLGLAYTLITTFTHYTPNVEEGLSTSIIAQGLATIASQPHLFIPLNISVTPLVVIALAGFGIFHAWRNGSRRMVVFLFVWFWGFVVLHAYVVPQEVAMQARYYLHMVVPMAFAASLGLAAIATSGPRWVLFSTILLLLASPLLHKEFIRDIQFADTLEYAFVVEIADQVPSGCTVVEYVGHLPPPREEYPEETLLSARFRFASERFEAGDRFIHVNSVSLGAHEGAPGLLSEEAEAVLRDPPECLMYYEGLLCWAEKEPHEPLAPACMHLRQRVDLEPIAMREVRSRMLDEAAALGLQRQDVPLQYTLYSVVREAQPTDEPDPQERPPLPWPLSVIQ